MSLNDALAGIYEGAKEHMPAGYLDALAEGTAEVKASGLEQKTVKAGEALPAFALTNHKGTIVRSDDLLAQGPLVVAVFRGGWCPFCTTELAHLQDIVAPLGELGAKLVAIAPQTPDKSREMAERRGLTFDLLHDAGSAYANKLGLVFTLSPRLQEIHTDLGGHLPEWNNDSSWRLPMPARLVVGQDGTVQACDIDADYTQRADPAKTLADVRRLVETGALV